MQPSHFNLILPPAGCRILSRGDEPEGTFLPKLAYRALQATLLGLAAILLTLHYVHLNADFPNFSPWMDWSKYTDEGWYGDAAVRHFQLGHWYVRGAFNPAVALPLWPLLETCVFRLTGVSLIAARALSVSVFGATLAAAWFLVRRSGLEAAPATDRWASQRASLAATATVLLLAASPFCYAFTRLAILEPLLVLLLTLALLAASRLRCRPESLKIELQRNCLPIAAVGLLIPAMILTKTTAIFLLPALMWMIFAALDYKFLPLLRVGSAIALLASGTWGAYYLGFVRPHYLEDYQYLFSANAYTFLTRDMLGSVMHDMFKGGWWLGKTLYLSAGFCILVALLSAVRLRKHPLVPTLLLWIGGYAAFLVYHNNLQPRYYYVLAVPITLLVPTVLSDLVLARVRSGTARNIAIVGVVALFLAIFVPDLRQTVGYVDHPEYTFVEAAAEIHNTIALVERKEPAHSWLVLSISGSDLSLMTGLPSISDDFSTLDLPDEIALYKPGWYVAWNQLEDDKMDALTPGYSVRRVASFPAMDDPERNQLILYRLDPAGAVSPRSRRDKASARQAHNRQGQQPSTVQLKH